MCRLASWAVAASNVRPLRDRSARGSTAFSHNCGRRTTGPGSGCRIGITATQPRPLLATAPRKLVSSTAKSKSCRSVSCGRGQVHASASRRRTRPRTTDHGVPAPGPQKPPTRPPVGGRSCRAASSWTRQPRGPPSGWGPSPREQRPSPICSRSARSAALSLAELRRAVFDGVEGWYKPHRLHSTLGYLSGPAGSDLPRHNDPSCTMTQPNCPSNNSIPNMAASRSLVRLPLKRRRPRECFCNAVSLPGPGLSGIS